VRGDLGPIWRSARRSRSFFLQVLEVAVGFLIVGNLAMTVRYYGQLALPPSGHREADVVEIVSRAPVAGPGGEGPRDAVALARLAEQRRRREGAALSALAGVRLVVPVSATQIDDRWDLPVVFWSDAGAGVGASACPGVSRSEDGVVVGWTIETTAALPEAVDLSFVEGGSLAALPAEEQAGAVIITRCLRDALFGGAPARGRTLRSNRFAPARIAGVIEDVRMRVPFLYHTEVTALFVAPPPDERVNRYLVRTEPGRSAAVMAAAPAALGADDPDRIVTTGVFGMDHTRSGSIAFGTVLILSAMTASLGVVAVLGNLAIAAFLVGERRRVIGVRRALGATRPDILGYLLLETLIPTQIGNLLGFVALVAMLPVAQKRFSGLRMEPADMLATALLLSLAGVAARLLPALRATRIPPSEASRSL
jgi:hypothetical protein